MPVPTYLERYAVQVKEGDYTDIRIRGKTGGELFEVYYFGDLFQNEHLPNPYIVDLYVGEETLPCKIVAKDVATGDFILIYDGFRHGYNGMFCEECGGQKARERQVVRYDLPPSKLHLRLGYSIDYEQEKEDFNVDENDRVRLINNEVISWDEVGRNGFDYFSLSCEDDGGSRIEIVSLELA